MTPVYERCVPPYLFQYSWNKRVTFRFRVSQVQEWTPYYLPETGKFRQIYRALQQQGKSWRYYFYDWSIMDMPLDLIIKSNNGVRYNGPENGEVTFGFQSLHS